MTKLRSLVVVLASCLALGGFAPDVSAQGWQDFGIGGDYRRGDRDRDDDRRWRDRDDDNDRRRGRDRDDDDDDRDRRGRDREWRGSYDRDCYYVRRRYVERDGDVVMRRFRVCED